MAVYLGNGKLLQSYAQHIGSNIPGVSIGISIEDSHCGYYYEYTILPEIWLN
jgi:hypothetical protein